MKNKYIFIIITLIILVILIFCSTSYAARQGSLNAIAQNVGIDTNGSTGNTVEIGNKVFGLVQTIGIIAGVIALMYIGIRYMVSSLEEKAQVKEAAKYYIIGAILAFSIPTVAKLIYEITIGLN